MKVLRLSNPAQEAETVLEDKIEEEKAEAAKKDLAPVRALHRAIQDRRVSDVEQLLQEHGGSIITASIDDSPMALHGAILCGFRDVLKPILDKLDEGGKIPSALDVQDSLSGYTALHMAVDYGQAEIVEELIQRGCDTDICNRRGKTAWDLANAERATSHVETVVDIFNKRALDGHDQLKREKGTQRQFRRSKRLVEPDK